MRTWNSGWLTIAASTKSTSRRWRRLTVMSVAFWLVVSRLTLAEGTTTVKIPDGTIVSVALAEALSSGTSHQNDPVHCEVTEDIKVGDAVVIAKGAPAIGHVTEAEPKGRWGHSGRLAFSIDYAKAVDRTNVRLRASSTQGGQDSKGALMLGLSGAFKHGKNIETTKGTVLSAYVDGDHNVSLQPNR